MTYFKMRIRTDRLNEASFEELGRIFYMILVMGGKLEVDPNEYNPADGLFTVKLEFPIIQMSLVFDAIMPLVIEGFGRIEIEYEKHEE